MRAAPAHHHADDVGAVAHHRRHQVKAGGSGISGLDPVGAGITADQIVMRDIDTAAIAEAGQGEVVKILREIVGQMPRQDAQIGGGGDLSLVGQARRIVVEGAAHAELRPLFLISSGKWHSLPPSASAIATAMSLAERTTMARMAMSVGTVLPGGRPSLVGY